VPNSGSAAPVVISANLFPDNTTTLNESTAVWTENTTTKTWTEDWQGAFTTLGTVNLLNIEVFPIFGVYVSLPCLSVQTFHTKYLAAANYPKNATFPFYPVFEGGWETTFLGPTSNFYYNGKFYTGIASGTITIGEPTKFVPTVGLSED
jgi:hypothetical protein